MPELSTSAIADVEERSAVKIRGRVTALRIEPADMPPALTARVSDETGAIEVVFLGRRSIPGIEPGTDLVVEGRACQGSPLMRIFNPVYELCQK